MRCLGCDKLLENYEETLCTECLCHLEPLDSGKEKNELWMDLCGTLQFEHATALSYYEPENVLSRLLQRAKYKGMPQVNAMLTRMLLEQLEESAWPYDIDVIIPVPIHWRRLLMRGYNQVAPIAETLSDNWHIPVEWGCLKRTSYLPSQVGVGMEQRQLNQKNSLSLRHPERIEGKHVLLVDDVYTTGSTLLTCADLLTAVPGVRISILTLAMTLQV